MTARRTSLNLRLHPPSPRSPRQICRISSQTCLARRRTPVRQQQTSPAPVGVVLALAKQLLWSWMRTQLGMLFSAHQQRRHPGLRRHLLRHHQQLRRMRMRCATHSLQHPRRISQQGVARAARRQQRPHLLRQRMMKMLCVGPCLQHRQRPRGPKPARRMRLPTSSASEMNLLLVAAAARHQAARQAAPVATRMRTWVLRTTRLLRQQRRVLRQVAMATCSRRWRCCGPSYNRHNNERRSSRGRYRSWRTSLQRWTWILLRCMPRCKNWRTSTGLSSRSCMRRASSRLRSWRLSWRSCAVLHPGLVARVVPRPLTLMRARLT
mmetsp:Transcript_19697/g.50039  ORF Transcript_19697/g.50039 Transcript_19697/m.50039 type:complete len:322 (-) Transcript_19697:272-1237(-)